MAKQLSILKEFSCVANNNTGFKVEVYKGLGEDGLRAELTRIENYLMRESKDSDPMPYMKYHDTEEIIAATLDKLVEQVKSRIRGLGFKILHWDEKAV